MKNKPPALISNVSALAKKIGLAENVFVGRLLSDYGVGEKTARRVFRGDTNISLAVIAKTAVLFGVEIGDVIKLVK